MTDLRQPGAVQPHHAERCDWDDRRFFRQLGQHERVRNRSFEFFTGPFDAELPSKLPALLACAPDQVRFVDSAGGGYEPLRTVCRLQMMMTTIPQIDDDVLQRLDIELADRTPTVACLLKSRQEGFPTFRRNPGEHPSPQSSSMRLKRSSGFDGRGSGGSLESTTATLQVRHLIYSDKMRPSVSAAGRLLLVVRLLVPHYGLAQANKPTINAVVNVASYASASISPGEMISIYGTGLGPAQLTHLQLDQQGRIASNLSGVMVTFDGNPAPLIYVSSTVVAAMVPFEIAGQQSTQIQLTYQGFASSLFQKGVAPSAPGVFTADSSGTGQVAMTNADGSYNSASNPVAIGSYVTFYLTGEGKTNPPGSDGNIAASTANVALPVTVSIANRAAQLLYAGSAPGNVNGFCQINAVIPPDLQYGGNLPLVVQIGGISSQIGVTVAVSGPPAPIPGSPQNVAASVNSSGQIVLMWTPADSMAARFHIERQIAGSGFTEVSMVDGVTTTFTDPNVTPGISYQYRIRAEDDYGVSPYSAVVSATVPGTLSPPSDLQAVAVSQTQINLTWSATNTNATQFHIERKIGSGTYSEIAAVPGSTVMYQDITLQPNTTFTYRIKSQAASSFSGYSTEAFATTLAVPLQPGPSLQGSATSSSQIHLSWTSTATGAIRFRIERSALGGAYSEISQPSATSTSFDDSGLNPFTPYLYRMRVETAAGLSAYSNVVTIVTLLSVTAIPAAPTSLQATAVSSIQINLSWTNNATNATAIRVESETAGSTTFTDIGTATTLTSTGVANLQPNTTYSFRVRAQNASGFSGYSNIVTAATLTGPTTVFLVHGIGQGSRNMQSLKATLESNLDSKRYLVNATFDYSYCDASPSCTAPCSISDGANLLASVVLSNTAPGSNVILIGFSMGGLMARDMIAHNYSGVVSTRKITALVTLGTPNLGYPYGSLDSSPIGSLISGTCPILAQQMYSDFRSQQSSKGVVLSTYLSGLASVWNGVSSSTYSGYWLAISGGYCKQPIRTGDLTASLGCPDYNVVSDGVVCDQSARYNVTGTNTPSQAWYGDPYAHTPNPILCGFSSGNAPLLYDPPKGDALSQTLWSAIQAH
jgi:uncharacterized protein (TIGR03437 family)